MRSWKLYLTVLNILICGQLSQAETIQDCAPLLDLDAKIINLPEVQSSSKLSGIFELAEQHIKVLCGFVESGEQSRCATLGLHVAHMAQNCFDSRLSVREVRALVTAPLRHPQFESLVVPSFLRDKSESAATVKQRLWVKNHILILPENSKTSEGPAKKLTTQDLLLLENGFEKLKRAIAFHVGAENVSQYAHLWNSYGIFARAGRAEVPNQFGMVLDDYILQIYMIVNIAQAGFSVEDIAQRIAHESAHIQDQISGWALGGKLQHWSETRDAQVFAYCKVPVAYETPLYGCREKQPTWFNFHPKNYAVNSAEFYGKMMDNWVREGLNLNGGVRYRCQSSITNLFWREMEHHMIGHSVSAECP